MSLDPSKKSDWLETALESTRRDVRQLEIDACRIRTNLARLEVANVTSLANGDVAAPSHRDEPSSASGQVSIVESDALDWRHATPAGPSGMELLVGAPSVGESSSATFDSPAIATESGFADVPPIADITSTGGGTNRRATSPVMASLFLHSAILLLTFSVTVATIEHNEHQFSATVLDLNDSHTENFESVDDHQLRDLGAAVAQDLGGDSKQIEGMGQVSNDEIPLDLKSVDGPQSLGAVSPLDPLATDMGTLLSGGGLSVDGKGSPTGLGKGNQRGRGGGGVAGGGRNAGGRLESTLFFGTEAKGDRFVFVVDNSSSMKDGRLEMANAELIRTIESLSPRQSFYVIFVSDQTYPMFYPQREPALVAATPANKKRLADWAPKAILASGKNRELIKAIDLAASLQPQAVYLLWDGDLRYSEKVRTEVMSYLTQPNHQWNFIIHTLGMGISSLESEMNLAAIAQAHSGIYRRIDLPPVRKR